MSGIKCHKCGAENDLDMPFCLACGTQFTVEDLPLLADRFQLQELIGEGGMSQVYLAEDRLAGCKVAVKLLKAERCEDLVGLERFMLEIKALSNLHHPNLVKVLSYGSEPRPYYVMPYLPGTTLAEKLETSGPLTPQEAAAIMEKLLGAIMVLHQAKILHRDIKSENVMFDDGGEPILLDLGAIKELETKQSRTAFGVIVGSPVALAPEQIMGQPLTCATDIYQLGVLFSEMLLGRQPFEAENTAAYLAAHLEQQPDLTGAAQKQAPELIKVALKAMSKNPQERYNSAKKMADAIAVAISGKKSLWQRLLG